MNADSVIVATQVNPQRVRRLFAGCDGRIQWIFLGRNQLRLRRWERALGEKFQRHSFAHEFQALAHEWRKPFLDWIAEESARYQSLTWWSSRLAEKNVLLDTIHHTVCYREIARRFRERNPKGLIVVESPALLSVLRQDFKRAAVGCRIRQGNWVGRAFRDRVIFILKWIWYWGDVLGGALDARLTRGRRSRLPKQDHRRTVVLHSFMDESFFSLGHDRYFNELDSKLTVSGHQVVILPRLFNIKRSRFSAFRYFRSQPDHYLIPEDFYSFSDYFWSMGILLRQRFWPRGPFIFQGQDITRLVREVQRRQSEMVRSAYYIRYYRLIRRLAAEGFRIDVFIDTFENMFNEKPSVMAFKRYMPKTLTVGYQHWASPGPLNYCNYTTTKEASIAPHPDVLVCCSPFTARIFADEGFSQREVRVGPSLRYPHLFRSPPSSARLSGRNVLALFCLEENAILHLLHTLLDAFASGPHDFTIWLKPHPLMDEGRWERMFEGRAPLPNMVKVGGKMDDWMPQTDCAVVGTSSTSMELAMAGIPVVQLGRENDFDLNVLHWFSEFGPPVYSATELNQAVRSALMLKPEQRAALRQLGQRLQKECLSPITDDTLSAFWRERPRDKI